MAGYNPNCDNCFKCITCKGDGTVQAPVVRDGKAWYERKTCSACNGVGGKPGAGKHSHS